MKNPFEYGGVVSGEAFCNRQKEIGDLLRAMENAEKLCDTKSPPVPILFCEQVLDSRLWGSTFSYPRFDEIFTVFGRAEVFRKRLSLLAGHNLTVQPRKSADSDGCQRLLLLL